MDMMVLLPYENHLKPLIYWYHVSTMAHVDDCVMDIHLPASFPSLIWNPGWQMFDSSVATARFFTHDAAKCAKCQITGNYCPKSTWVPGASNYQGLRFQKVYPVACSHRGSGSWTILNDIVNVYIYIIWYYVQNAYIYIYYINCFLLLLWLALLVLFYVYMYVYIYI